MCVDGLVEKSRACEVNGYREHGSRRLNGQYIKHEDRCGGRRRILQMMMTGKVGKGVGFGLRRSPSLNAGK